MRKFFYNNNDISSNPALVESQRIRDEALASARPEASDFGYSPDNPVPTSGHYGTLSYLNRLRTPEGRRLSFERAGSVVQSDAQEVDVYWLYLDGKDYCKLYFQTYAHQTEYVPRGLVLLKE